jgi:farnesyl diphosphate synthase
MAKQTTLEEFNSVYPKLEEALLDHARSYKLPQEQLDWYKRVSLNSDMKLFPTL